MKIIGFNFTKLNAERTEMKKTPLGVATDIKFLNIEKEEKLDVLKSGDILKVDFSYTVSYQTTETKKSAASIIIEGFALIAAEKNEVKEILSVWKKKDLSTNFKLFLFNFILRKCTPKALSMESELDLPYHIPIPRLSPIQETENASDRDKKKK